MVYASTHYVALSGVESFQGHQRTIETLPDEVQRVEDGLQSLLEAGKSPNTSLSSLKPPLLRGKVFKGFENGIADRRLGLRVRGARMVLQPFSTHVAIGRQIWRWPAGSALRVSSIRLTESKFAPDGWWQSHHLIATATLVTASMGSPPSQCATSQMIPLRW